MIRFLVLQDEERKHAGMCGECLGGYVWGQTLMLNPKLPSPSDWGWMHTDDGWKPYWTTLPEAASACYELIHCGCKKACRGQCKCKRNALSCTELCAGEGGCAE